MRRIVRAVATCATLVLMASTVARAHSGPPFPLVSNKSAGPYTISIWTDPDATNDGRPAGQFWVMLAGSPATSPVPQGTHANVSIAPLDRTGPARMASAEPVNRDVSHQFAAVLMDHEGRYAVRVIVDGPLGQAEVDSDVESTYDARPSPALLVVYLMPFLLAGFLWFKLLVRRRRGY